MLALGLTVAPFRAEAQPPGKVARLGVVLFGSAANDPNLTAFASGLRDLGYVEGRNFTLEARSAEGHPERIRETALNLTGVAFVSAETASKRRQFLLGRADYVIE